MEDNCINHAERISALETNVTGLKDSVGGLAHVVDNLSSEIRRITKSVDKLKYVLYALVILQFSETKSVEVVLKAVIKLITGVN